MCATIMFTNIQVNHWIRETGSVRSEKASTPSIPLDASHSRNKTARTYANWSPEPPAKKLRLNEYRFYQISLFIIDRDSEDSDDIAPVLSSPRKKFIHVPVTPDLSESSEEENWKSLLNFRSFQSPLDNTWWSYLKVIPHLRPVVDQRDPHVIKIAFEMLPLSAEEIELFPEAFQRGIRCPANNSLLV